MSEQVVNGASAPGAPDEASAAGKFGWAMFDWANQPFFTLVVTFIFAPYFTSVVVGDPVRGQALWGYTQAIAGVTIAVLAPFLGAIAEAGGPRKPWIGCFTLHCIVGSCLLWLATPAADPGRLDLILALVIIATIGAEFAIVFNNAMLPSLVPDQKMGGLSGNAWGIGYVGGLLALAVVLLGFSFPEEPLFGLDKASHQHDRMVGPMTGIWFALFVLPLFLWTPDSRPSGLGLVQASRAGVAKLMLTLRRLGRLRNVAKYLVARMIYYDGQTAIFAFGGIYAAGLFGWSSTELGIFGIVILVFAALGCFVGARMDDRLGSKSTIIIALVGLIFCTLGVVSIGDGRAFFVVAVDMPVADQALFASTAERIFMAIAILLGICGGPAQAASRTMLARLVPRENVGEFFGLYALSGKATAFMAPLSIAFLTESFESLRVAIAVILVFLVVGLLGLLTVREERAEAPH